MGTSTNGQICFGVLLNEDTELPWDDDEKYDDGIYDWWDNASSKMKGQSLPIKSVNVCSRDNPIWILAIPSTYIQCYRGYPVVFLPDKLNLLYSEDKVEALLEFCNTYGIEFEGEPQWWLSSYWG